MTIGKILSVPPTSVASDFALLAIRIVGGAAFMMHGWSKIRDPFNWMGPDSFAPGVFQGLAALSEFGGGLAWILGLLTPIASMGIGFTMVVAVFFHAVMRGDPFVGAGGGASYELAAVYLCIALLVFAIGPGRLSLDRVLFGGRS